MVRPTSMVSKKLIKMKKKVLWNVKETGHVNVDREVQAAWLLAGESPVCDDQLTSLIRLKTGGMVEYHSTLATAFYNWAWLALRAAKQIRELEIDNPIGSPVGRLKKAYMNWEQVFGKMRLQKFHTKMILEGFKIKCPGYQGQRRLPKPLEEQENRDIIAEELLEEIRLGCIDIVTPQSEPAMFQGEKPQLTAENHFHSVFAVYQNGKWRAVHNMIELNEYGGKIGYKSYPFRHMQHLMRLNDFMDNSPGGPR